MLKFDQVGLDVVVGQQFGGFAECQKKDNQSPGILFDRSFGEAFESHLLLKTNEAGIIAKGLGIFGPLFGNGKL